MLLLHTGSLRASKQHVSKQHAYYIAGTCSSHDHRCAHAYEGVLGTCMHCMYNQAPRGDTTVTHRISLNQGSPGTPCPNRSGVAPSGPKYTKRLPLML